MHKKLLYSLILCVAISISCALSAEAAKIKVDIGFCGINYSITSNKIWLIPGMLEMRPIEPKLPWESIAVSATKYHVRIPGMNDSFLKLDAGTKQVFIVSGGTFGKEGGSEKILKTASFVQPPPFMKPIPDLIQVQVTGALLSYDSVTNDVAVMCDGFKLMDKEALEIIGPEEGIYHVRIRGAQDTKVAEDRFWKVDAIRKKVTFIIGRFGERGGREIKFEANVTIEDEEGAAWKREVHAVHEDLGMDEDREKQYHASAWVETEQELFYEVLKRQPADVLVAPFQVQDYAFDHIERSLMTKYLIRQIKMTTDSRIADPDIAERSLGWGKRTFSEQRIYRLANVLGVKKLVRIFVGHNRDMKMRITAVVQDRPQGGVFDTATKTKEIVYQDIAFSDENLPSNAFASMLTTVIADMGIKEIRREAPADVPRLKDVPLPLTLLDSVQSKETSPLVLAAHLAVAGSLSPAGSRTSQDFFERSLTLLRGVSPNSSDALFLKAYAFSQLYRRPAAVDVLRKPLTPEQLALRFYLDGDLTALPAQVEKIQSPIPKVLMQIALNDLRWSYDEQTARSMTIKANQDVPLGWRLFYTRRYTLADPWNVESTLELKQFLDEKYLLKGYSLQDIARGMAIRGEINPVDDAKIDASVSEHRKRILQDRPELSDGDPQRSIRPLDLLDIVEAWSEEAMIKRIKLPVNIQALWEEGITTIDRYEFYFQGHPELAALKSTALRRLARLKGGAEGKNLVKKADELDTDACSWFQGQTRSANTVCSSKMYYENDFPRREFWRRHKDSSLYGDREKYDLRETVVTSPETSNEFFARLFKSELRDRDLALRYTIPDFERFEDYYNVFASRNMTPEADTLFERNKHRFNGNPFKTAFRATQYEKTGEEQKIVRLYEDIIPVVPGVWAPYYELGYHYLKNGDTRRAKETFRRYPLFRDKGKTNSENSVDDVMLSNNANAAGIALHWAGAVHDARPFFELSAGYQTGSGRGMRSEYLLAMYDRNYQRAAEVLLSLYRRYGGTNAYSDYLRLIRIVSYTPEWESLFFSLNMMEQSSTWWSPVLTDLRMAGKNDEEVRVWLSEYGKGKVGRYQAQLYYLRAFLVDRQPDASLADMIENIEKHVPLSEKQSMPVKMKNREGMDVLSIPSLFAASRNTLMLRQFDKAFNLLEPWSSVPQWVVKGDGRSLLPYFAWSGAKTAKSEPVDKVVSLYQRANGRDFEYWLAMAMIQAASQKHDVALKSLDLARVNVKSSLMDTRPVQAWYQLVEVCELLYEDTQIVAYRNRAIELARLYELVQPLDSWAYAVEAKYAKTEEDRLRPLALTLYLDRRSYHLEGISEKEKEHALKWLETNNPFLQVQQQEKKNEI